MTNTSTATIQTGSVKIAGRTFTAEVVEIVGGSADGHTGLHLTGARGGFKFLVEVLGAKRPNTYIVNSYTAAGPMRDKYGRTVKVCWDGRTIEGLIEVTA